MSEVETTKRRRTPALAAAYAVAALAVCAVAAVVQPLPSPVALAVFVALAVWAENDGIKLPSSVSVSPSLLVVMATITALDGKGSVLGAALVGLSCGAVVDLIRKRKVVAIVVTGSQFALASAAAASAYELGRGVLPSIASVILASVVFAAINVGLILPAIVMEYDRKPAAVWADMRPALPNYLAFGLLGALVGELYDSLGWLAVVLLMTPVAVARTTFSSFLELVSAHEATIGVFLRAIEAKDEYTAKHTQRVCRFSIYIGEELGFNHAKLEHLRRAALMHDIGKLAVPKHLLNKPGRLTDEEFRVVQQHAHVCIDILDLVDFLKPMTAAAAGHHARFDGGGYGGTGDYPIEAYVVAVADAFDAMTSTRAYRKALPMETAFEELRNKSGSQFHPDCVEGLIAAITKRNEHYGEGYETDVIHYEVEPPKAGVGSAGLGDTQK